MLVFGAPGAVGDPGFAGAGVADAEVAVEGDEVGGVHAIADEREHDALGGYRLTPPHLIRRQDQTGIAMNARKAKSQPV